MEVWVLWNTDGVIGVYSSEALAENTKLFNHDNDYYHYEDQVIEKCRLQSEVIDD